MRQAIKLLRHCVSGFMLLTLSGQLIICWVEGVVSCAFGMFGSIPALNLLDASSRTPSMTAEINSKYCQISLGAKVSVVEMTALM